MSVLRDLLVCLSMHTTLSFALSVNEIVGYKTTMEVQTNASSISDAELEKLKTALSAQGALITSLNSQTDLDTNESTIVLEYDDAATERALENLLESSEAASLMLTTALNQDIDFDAADYVSEAELAFQEQVAFTVVTPTTTASSGLPTELGKDIVKLTNEAPKDVKVFQLPPEALLAYARMPGKADGADGSPFHKMNEELQAANIANESSQTLDGSWMTRTAAALGVPASDFSIEKMSIEKYPAARGYIEFSYSADPNAANISQLLTGAKRSDENPVSALEFAIFTDMRSALELPYFTGDIQIPFSQIIQFKSEGFIMAYDIEDPMMWAMGRLVKEPKDLDLTHALSFLQDTLRLPETPKLTILAMEQQDVSGAGYALILATFVGAGDIMDDENELHAMEYALRNDIMKTFDIIQEDMFDIYIDREPASQLANGSFLLVVEPDSEESYKILSQQMKEKEQDNSWIVEARRQQPGLQLKDSDDGSSAGGDRTVTVQDDTCRVGSVHCDHIKGIAALLVVTIVVSAIGYYFVIYRPSKKYQHNSVQELPANHTFVFSRSLGASTHRSTASSFYGGTRRIPTRPGQNEEVDMGEVQFDENSQQAGMYAGTHDAHHTSNQHPASYV